MSRVTEERKPAGSSSEDRDAQPAAAKAMQSLHSGEKGIAHKKGTLPPALVLPPPPALVHCRRKVQRALWRTTLRGEQKLYSLRCPRHGYSEKAAPLRVRGCRRRSPSPLSDTVLTADTSLRPRTFAIICWGGAHRHVRMPQGVSDTDTVS